MTIEPPDFTPDEIVAPEPEEPKGVDLKILTADNLMDTALNSYNPLSRLMKLLADGEERNAHVYFVIDEIGSMRWKYIPKEMVELAYAREIIESYLKLHEAWWN